MTDPHARSTTSGPRHTDASEPPYDDVRLSDGRVTLRPWRVADAALMAAACADPDTFKACAPLRPDLTSSFLSRFKSSDAIVTSKPAEVMGGSCHVIT